jgi:integrase
VREAALKICFDKSKSLYYYSLPPKLSETGKRQRVHFKDERTAKERLREIKKEKDEGFQIIQRNSTERIRNLLQWDEELKSSYGMTGGLEALYADFKRRSEAEHKSTKFGELCRRYEEETKPDWSKKSAANWSWFRKLVDFLDEESIIRLDLDYWKGWIKSVTRERNLKVRSVRDVLGRLSAVWNYAVNNGLADTNPIAGVRRPKPPKGKPSVLSVDEAKSIMESAWKHDRAVVPYFAFAIFAGLRPDYSKRGSEITKLLWEDVNFEDTHIRVAADYDNKTGTKRFVKMQPNLIEWVSDWKGSTGPVCPKNLRRRIVKVLSGHHNAKTGALKKDWVPLIDSSKSRQDIFRHTFGSFFAVGRKQDEVSEAMGHADYKTFQQHYRNAQSPKEAEAFWNIRPPKD